MSVQDLGISVDTLWMLLGSHVGLFHAAGICPLRGGLYP